MCCAQCFQLCHLSTLRSGAGPHLCPGTCPVLALGLALGWRLQRDVVRVSAQPRACKTCPAQGLCQPSCGSAATGRHCGHLVLLVVWLMLHKAGAASLGCSKGSPWPWAAGPPGCCCGSFPGRTVHGLPLEVSTVGHHGSGKGRAELWERWGSYGGEDGNND